MPVSPSSAWAMPKPARDALVVQLPPALHVGQRGMGEDELARREGRTQALRGIDARAEERDLEAPQPPVGARLAGDVPPFGAQVGVAAVVARKGQGARGQRAGAPAQGAECAQRQQRAAGYQASSACSRCSAAAQSPMQHRTQAASW